MAKYKTIETCTTAEEYYVCTHTHSYPSENTVQVYESFVGDISNSNGNLR